MVSERQGGGPLQARSSADQPITPRFAWSRFWWMARLLPSTGEVAIGPGRRRVEIEFTACSLRAPERVVFRYKLENFDPHWIAATGRRAATYDNLPPGQYRFRVTARDGSLDAGSEAGISLVVQPHFYQTAWFYALAVLAACAGVAGVFLYQERQAREHYNLRLAERTRIAREMHDTVVQGCVGVSTLIEAAVGSARSDQDLMLECLDNARIHLRLTLDEARQALTDLRHDSFENGLPGALSDLRKRVEQRKRNSRDARSRRRRGAPGGLHKPHPAARDPRGDSQRPDACARQPPSRSVCFLDCRPSGSIFRTMAAASSRLPRLSRRRATSGSSACASVWNRFGVPWRWPVVRESGTTVTARLPLAHTAGLTGV